jgi:hypothetical protein
MDSKYFSKFLMTFTTAAFLIGSTVMAMPVTKVHMLQNLNETEARLAKKMIERNGYQLSKRGLFSESEKAIVITKAIGDELEPASIQVEFVQKAKSDQVPKTIYNLKLETQDLVDVLEKIPSPSQLDSSPVALQ